MTSHEHGAAGLTTVLAAAVVLVVGAAATIAAADLATTASRARAAADAAALAAAATSPLVAPGDPGDRNAAAAAARTIARANGATLTKTDLRHWPLRVHVEVSVPPSTAWVRRHVGPMRAGATAGVRPRDG